MNDLGVGVWTTEVAEGTEVFERIIRDSSLGVSPRKARKARKLRWGWAVGLPFWGLGGFGTVRGFVHGIHGIHGRFDGRWVSGRGIFG